MIACLGGFVAWVWRNCTFENLNNLIPPGSGFTLDAATAINDNGQIVANGYSSIGQEHAFLLSPSSGHGSTASTARCTFSRTTPPPSPSVTSRAAGYGPGHPPGTKA